MGRKFFWLILAITAFGEFVPSYACADYHLATWVNTFIPGGGEDYYGNWGQGLMELGIEGVPFAAGMAISNGSEFSVDGLASSIPSGKNVLRKGGHPYETEFLGDILQEFGVKAHMIDTYDFYRTRAKLEGADMSQFDQHPMNELFYSPFSSQYLEDPMVYFPILGVMAYSLGTLAVEAKNGFQKTTQLDTSSNVLYAFNYSIWQPFGSGAPEEAFYRGFLQTEFRSWVDSPFFSIPLETAAFAFSHAPGNGRVTAAVAGAYLGYLVDHYHGQLGPGIAVHFWGTLILGIQTVIESTKGQNSTPPTGMSVQIHF